MTSSVEPLLADFVGHTLAGDLPVSSSHREGVLAHDVHWRWLGEGLLQFEPGRIGSVAGDTRSVLVSAGIHGDETAPIELLSRFVRDLAAGRARLACRLLVVLGNVDAMRAARRYLDDDLNRLFGGAHARVPASREAPRAALLEEIARRFFAAGAAAPLARWHLDMHTAIRASAFEQFALLPYTGTPPSRAMFGWLADARLAAVLIHTEKGSTYSHFTSQACGALACTLELGKVRPFGENDLARFAAADDALRRLVAGIGPDPAAPMPRVFTVAGQITKRSDAFELLLAADVPNFTPVARGMLLARDGESRYVVAHDDARIVFPNPSVKPGLRAGLLVVDTTHETLASLS